MLCVMQSLAEADSDWFPKCFGKMVLFSCLVFSVAVWLWKWGGLCGWIWPRAVWEVWAASSFGSARMSEASISGYTHPRSMSNLPVFLYGSSRDTHPRLFVYGALKHLSILTRLSFPVLEVVHSLTCLLTERLIVNVWQFDYIFYLMQVHNLKHNSMNKIDKYHTKFNILFLYVT